VTPGTAAAPAVRYRTLLRIPHVRGLLAAGFVGRLPIGMLSLAIVLLVSRATGSYATAGLVVAAQALASGAAAPFLGRLMDRVGQTPVLLACAAVFPCAVAGLIAVAEWAPQTVPLLACAVVFGVSYPPLFAALRTLLSELAGRAGVAETAFALEAIMQELFFILGPLTVAVVVALASPQVALALVGAMTAAGTIAFAALPPSRGWRPVRPPTEHRHGVLSSAGMRTLLVVSAAYGVAFGTLEIAVPAFCSERGAPGAAGVVLAAVGVGSMIGGIAYGARTWTVPPGELLIRFGALFALAMVPIAFAGSIGQMLVLMPIAGLFVAPWAAVSYGLIGHLTPAGTISEAFTWETTAVIAGFSIGGAISGVLVEGPGVRAALLFAAALAGVSAVTAWARRGSLGPEPLGRP
jgi:MFS family permease